MRLVWIVMFEKSILLIRRVRVSPRRIQKQSVTLKMPGREFFMPQQKKLKPELSTRRLRRDGLLERGLIPASHASDDALRSSLLRAG